MFQPMLEFQSMLEIESQKRNQKSTRYYLIVMKPHLSLSAPNALIDGITVTHTERRVGRVFIIWSTMPSTHRAFMDGPMKEVWYYVSIYSKQIETFQQNLNKKLAGVTHRLYAISHNCGIFLISPDFHRGGRFRRQIPSLFSMCFVVHINTYLFQWGYFYVGLWGAEWYFLLENPTFFVRRNRKIPHHKNSHCIYRAVAAPPYPLWLCRHSPWQHPPRTQIVAPWLPMSLLQAASARVRAHCDQFPCLGRQNGTHR